MSVQAASVVFVHAHPDDESILTGSTLARATDLGIRTVVVFGTRGDAGETSADLGGETLGERRTREAEAACADLGVARVEWLGYADSGMAGSDTAGADGAFSNAPAERVAAEIAALLADERVFAVVGYDANGTYGHPDHVQVHAVAREAAAALGADWWLDVSYNREHIAALPDSDGTLDPAFAAADADLTHFVTGDDLLHRKLHALMKHRSQVPDDWDADNPDVDRFRARFGAEWYIARPVDGARDLGVLADLLDPKSAWIPHDEPAGVDFLFE